MRHSGTRLIALYVCGLAIGCDGTANHRTAAAPAGSGPAVRLVSSVLLQESDVFYVGQPSSLAIDPVDGSFYIADGYSSRAYRFTRTGQPIRTYGEPGEGPGEVRDTRSALTVGDTLVAVDDFRDRTLELYDRTTGSFRGRRPHGGISGGQVLYSAAGDTVWLAWPDFPEGKFAVSEWVPRLNTLRTMSQVPAVYRSHTAYFAASGLTVSLAPYRDGFLLGYGSLPRVYVISGDGELRDSVLVPARRRRVIPDDVIEIMESASEADKRAAISVLLRTHRMSSGDYLLVQSDPMMRGTYPAVEMWAEYYVSLLNPTLTRACVDAPLDLGERTHAIFLTHADTLFAVTQLVVDPEDEDEPPHAETWIKAWLVDSEGCDWMDTELGHKEDAVGERVGR